MDGAELVRRISLGEDISTEFKRCGSKPGPDTFETICSFANRQGGDIFLGVLDDGTLEGVAASNVTTVERNIANVISNHDLFNDAPLVEFEQIQVAGKIVLHVWVPMGPAVYRYKGVIYDRVADTDVKIRSESRIPDMYVRKQGIFTERTVYPYMRVDDLRGDLLERARQMAASRRSDHPWLSMDDEELLRSAGLVIRDYMTGKEGLCLAAALLFGKDITIRNILPTYETDALVRIRDTDRYDDREIVRTNLIEAYDRLYAFCQRNLPDPFMLEGVQSVSVRDIVTRELVSNLLAHREYTSHLPARLTILPDGIHTENASRSRFEGRLTPSGFSPMPKNPLIADVFLQIGLVEKLGSGVRNLYRVSRQRLHADPVLEDGDVFRAFVALAPVASTPAGSAVTSGNTSQTKSPRSSTRDVLVGRGKSQELADLARSLVQEKGHVTTAELAEMSGRSLRTTRNALNALVDLGILQAQGQTNRRRYVPGPGWPAGVPSSSDQ